jgi:hypothetical protein
VPAATDTCTDAVGARGLSREEMEAAALEGRQVGTGLDEETAARLLRQGELTVVGRMLSASNATFYAIVGEPGPEGELGPAVSCVYKPQAGERPLVDFPDGTLAAREVAAYEVSRASGWEIVPPTVLRDGPLGPGMVQLWVEAEESDDPGLLPESDDPALRRVALLDVVLNNADRKGGHLLRLADGRVMAIDNGLCFAVSPKLRTILWQWRGLPLDDAEVTMLTALRADLEGALGERLRELLDEREVEATAKRVDQLLADPRFPLPDTRRPVVPWPPF